MSGDPAYTKSLDTAPTPDKEDKRARKHLQQRCGFKYRKAVGELIWAMCICRPDISYAATKLSQFGDNPGQLHYEAVLQTLQYLSVTRTHGLTYWRRTPLTTCGLSHKASDLPLSLPQDAVDPTIYEPDPHTIYGHVDSDWATDIRHRRSVTGIHFKLAGAVIAYKTRVQPTVALSSTEAEFSAAADAGRMALRLRHILDELQVEQRHATMIYEDNMGALHMSNASKPTKGTRHIDIKDFAIQDWVEQDLITLERIETSDNSSDALTKALARILFYRHNDSIMGRNKPHYLDNAYADIQENNDIPTQ